MQLGVRVSLGHTDCILLFDKSKEETAELLRDSYNNTEARYDIVTYTVRRSAA